MRNFVKVSLITVVCGLLSASNGFALNLGSNITIADLVGTGTGWHGAQEDQETEPGTQTNQAWDMEGFFLKDRMLSMVGGYDFVNGKDNIFSGDIFLDVDGDILHDGKDNISDKVVKNNGYAPISNIFGYDYALKMDFAKLTYDIIKLDKNSTLETPYYRMNDESGGFKYKSGGTVIGSGVIGYQTNLMDSEVGFLGDTLVNKTETINGKKVTTKVSKAGTHNVVTVDLSFLTQYAPVKDNVKFTSHFTMGCGNDNLMGQAVVTPEPATIALLGLGLLGIVGIARKRMK
jgi:hypothetical protein